MPHWTDRPDARDAQHAFRIVRTPADRPLQAIITSDQATGCYTHYANHRTTPCEAPGICDLCTDGHSRRWHGYAAVLDAKTLEHMIFEFTPTAADVLHNYANQNASLRGCGIIATRPSGRPNGRVLLKTIPVDLIKWQLPDPIDLQAVLCHIWGVQRSVAQTEPGAFTVVDAMRIGRGNGDARNGRKLREPKPKPA